MLLKSHHNLSYANEFENSFYNVLNNFSESVCFVVLATTPTPINPCEYLRLDTRSHRELQGNKEMKPFAIVKLR